jgi:hypothetical protein
MLVAKAMLGKYQRYSRLESVHNLLEGDYGSPDCLEHLAARNVSFGMRHC